jgi:hypothetical protein
MREQSRKGSAVTDTPRGHVNHRRRWDASSKSLIFLTRQRPLGLAHHSAKKGRPGCQFQATRNRNGNYILLTTFRTEELCLSASERAALRIKGGEKLLALAHDRACEAELAAAVEASMPETENCPISTPPAGVSHRIRPPSPTSPSRRHRCIFTTSSAQSSRLVRHEND